MDTFFEQIVQIKKGVKDIVLLIAIFGVAAIIIYFAATLFFGTTLMSFAFLLCVFVAWGSYKLASGLYKEYEYIITNGTLDVDKISAKSSRKRELSLELSAVESIERYKGFIPKGDFKKVITACNLDDENAYILIVKEDTKGKRLLVFAPDERMKGAIVKFLPKFLANSAFKD